MVTAAISSTAFSVEEKLWFNLDSIFKSRDITLVTKVSLVNAILFPVVTHLCENSDHNKSWAPKNWCFWTVVFENTLDSPLDCEEIKPVVPKGNESWIFIGRTDDEAAAPILWPLDAKNWLNGKYPDAGTDWRQKGWTEDEVVGWNHQCEGHGFEQALGVGMDRKALYAAVHGLSKSWTSLSNWTLGLVPYSLDFLHLFIITPWCPTLCNHMVCSLSCSSIHGLLQGRILEWVAIPFSRVSIQPRDGTWVFIVWATREAQSKIKKLKGYTFSSHFPSSLGYNVT